MQTALEVDILSGTPGMNDKRNLLFKNKDNAELRRYFKLCLDATMQFGIKKIDWEYRVNRLSPTTLTEVFDYIEDNFPFSTNEKKRALAELMNGLHQADWDLVVNVLRKDPRCGVAGSLVSQCWPKLLPAGAKLMKAQPYSVKNMKAIRWPALSQLKSDGARDLFMVYKDDLGKHTFSVVSSGNKPLTGIVGTEWGDKFFESALETVEASGYNYDEDPETGLQFVFDGEAVVLDNDGNVMSRKAGNGIINKAIQGTISAEEAARIRVVVWDVISGKGYAEGVDPRPYEDRLKVAEALAKQPHGMFRMTETRVVNNMEEAYAHFKDLLSRGEEGSIIKNRHAPWEDRRSKHQVKLKLEIEVTLKITGIKPGTGKYVGLVGSVNCESSDGKVRVNVAGISDEQRRDWMDDHLRPDFVEVRSNGLIDAEGRETFSLFLPRIVDIRLDKTEADSYDTILAVQTAALTLK